MRRSDSILRHYRDALAGVCALPIETPENRIQFLRSFVSLLNELLYERRASDEVDELNSPDSDHPNWRRLTPFLAIWDDYAEQVLGFTFDDRQIDMLAQRLVHGLGASQAVSFVPRALDPDIPSGHLAGLTPRQFAVVRLMHALQDFSEVLPEIDAHLVERIVSSMPLHRVPTEADLGAEDGSRALLAAFGGADRNVDERIRYIRDTAHILVQAHPEGVQGLAEECEGDAERLFRVLVTLPGIQSKKAYMLLRDFYELGIWDLRAGLMTLEVIPDNRLMRIALRTGVIAPGSGKLVNSLLDEFDFQYVLTARATVEGFRRVWERTRNHNGGIPIAPYPARLDKFLFELGDGRVGCCKPGSPVCISHRRPRHFHEYLESSHGWRCDTACPFEGICPEGKKLLLAPYAIQNNTWLKIFTGKGGGGGLRGV